MTPAAIDLIFQRLADQAEFIENHQSHGAYNPARPHSLRTAFRTILTDAGLNENFIEFFMGHAIPEQKHAYLAKSTDSWRKTYAKFEEYLAIEESTSILPSYFVEALSKVPSDQLDQLHQLLISILQGNPELRTSFQRIQNGRNSN